jgi:hypothetical protein
VMAPMKVMIFLGIGETMESIFVYIKVRKNARVGWKKGNILRNLSVISQKKDLQKWKDSVIWTKMDC